MLEADPSDLDGRLGGRDRDEDELPAPVLDDPKVGVKRSGEREGVHQAEAAGEVVRDLPIDLDRARAQEHPRLAGARDHVSQVSQNEEERDRLVLGVRPGGRALQPLRPLAGDGPAPGSGPALQTECHSSPSFVGGFARARRVGLAGASSGSLTSSGAGTSSGVGVFSGSGTLSAAGGATAGAASTSGASSSSTFSPRSSGVTSSSRTRIERRRQGSERLSRVMTRWPTPSESGFIFSSAVFSVTLSSVTE